ncbi:MAG TPA: NAD-dependent epimerase/dehydratase family protein [Casimicrobiaceae bacterium]
MVMSPTRDSALIVVTGASGFVGTALTSHLRNAHRRFRGIVRALKFSQTPSAEYHVISDLATAPDDALAHALAGARAVVHLAGRAHVMHEPLRDSLVAHREANVVATQRVAKAAARAGVKRFLFVSSIKVNGEATPPGHPFHESDPPRPYQAYGRTKWEAEQALWDVAKPTGMSCFVLRPPLVYGPHVRGNFLALWRAVERGVPLPLGRIDNRRNLLYVGNLIHAIVALLDSPMDDGGTWLIADRDSVSTPELVNRIAAALRIPSPLAQLPVTLLRAGAAVTGRRAMASRLVDSLEIDASALVQRIGPLPYSLDQGLAATAAWWRSRQE